MESAGSSSARAASGAARTSANQAAVRARMAVGTHGRAIRFAPAKGIVDHRCRPRVPAAMAANPTRPLLGLGLGLSLVWGAQACNGRPAVRDPAPGDRAVALVTPEGGPSDLQ